MKTIIINAVLVSASLFVFNSNALADSCPSGEFDIVDGVPVCKVVNDVPEPSSPMLFLVAAGVAGIVLKMRKKK